MKFIDLVLCIELCHQAERISAYNCSEGELKQPGGGDDYLCSLCSVKTEVGVWSVCC